MSDLGGSELERSMCVDRKESIVKHRREEIERKIEANVRFLRVGRYVCQWL